MHARWALLYNWKKEKKTLIKHKLKIEIKINKIYINQKAKTNIKRERERKKETTKKQ